MQSSKSAVWASSPSKLPGRQQTRGKRPTDYKRLSRRQSIAMDGHYFGSDSNEETTCIIEENRKI